MYIFSQQIEEFQWHYDNNKSHKKPGLHPLSRRYIFGKTAGGSNWTKNTIESVRR